MFRINEDMTIECTRGDAVLFSVGANINGEAYSFSVGEVVRFSVFGKKDCTNVVLQKDTTIRQPSNKVRIELSGEDTKIGEAINKATDYWYEVELNPDSYPQTIIGYDQDGAKVFRLYPESEV
jgi:hypothetical protein